LKIQFSCHVLLICFCDCHDDRSGDDSAIKYNMSLRSNGYM